MLGNKYPPQKECRDKDGEIHLWLRSTDLIHLWVNHRYTVPSGLGPENEEMLLNLPQVCAQLVQCG